jgi:hypothetical protein
MSQGVAPLCSLKGSWVALWRRKVVPHGVDMVRSSKKKGNKDVPVQSSVFLQYQAERYGRYRTMDGLVYGGRESAARAVERFTRHFAQKGTSERVRIKE